MDEPELHLHPGLVSRVAQLLDAGAEQHAILVATHSRPLLDALVDPGESTILALPLLMGMHTGMPGVHVFAVDIRTNDPRQPVKTVRWRFIV